VSSGRERLDEALASRRRESALAELGEIVLELVRRGEIELAELPEAHDVVARLDELDGGDRTADARGSSAPRDRFDRRGPRANADDGTVSAQTWAPPTGTRSRDRVWRPPPASPPAQSDDDLAALDRPTTRGTRKPARPARPGGITFDDAAAATDADSDLADYMHPDDIPPKGRSDGDS